MIFLFRCIMKKILAAIVIFIAGCVSYPTIKANLIEYKVRDYLKKVNVNEFLEPEYKFAGIKVKTQGENQYPQFIATGTLNYGLDIQLPQLIVQQAQQKIAEKSCNGLEKLKQKDIDIRKGIVEVAQQDQVRFIVILQDKNQHQLIRHEQKIADCPNFMSLVQ